MRSFIQLLGVFAAMGSIFGGYILSTLFFKDFSAPQEAAVAATAAAMAVIPYVLARSVEMMAPSNDR